MPLQDPGQGKRYEDNGVVSRQDGGGDEWAKAHRKKLGRRYLMTDVDGYFGYITFAKNTSDHLFTEYVDDQPTDSVALIRETATVAWFDRKESRSVVQKRDGSQDRDVATQTAHFLGTLRKLKRCQPSPPRFFYVFGGEQGPWEMVELSLTTGKEIRSIWVTNDSFQEVWDAIGLTELRRQLRNGLLRDAQNGAA